MYYTTQYIYRLAYSLYRNGGLNKIKFISLAYCTSYDDVSYTDVGETFFRSDPLVRTYIFFKNIDVQ